MKIFKHTFKIPKLEVTDDGELIQSGNTEVTYTFTLLHKGTGVFEELSGGKPLMSYLTKIKQDSVEETISSFYDKQFIPTLACASYVKIENNKFHNNRATAEEFKKSIVYPHITDDIDFMTKLVEMAVECVLGEQKALAKAESDVKSSKK